MCFQKCNDNAGQRSDVQSVVPAQFAKAIASTICGRGVVSGSHRKAFSKGMDDQNDCTPRRRSRPFFFDGEKNRACERFSFYFANSSKVSIISDPVAYHVRTNLPPTMSLLGEVGSSVMLLRKVKIYLSFTAAVQAGPRRYDHRRRRYDRRSG